MIAFQHLGTVDGLPERNVYRILQDRLGFMWLGTSNGLVRYDGQVFTAYKPDPADPHSLSGRLIISLHEDRAGELWIGTYGGGLNRYDRERDHFIHYRHDSLNPRSLSFDMVGAIFEDSGGELWIGTGDVEVSGGEGGGLNRLDRETGTFTRYQHDPADPESLSHEAVSAIAEGHDGELWVATAGGGLNRLDRQTGKFVHLRHHPDDPGSLSDDHITVLFTDRAGRIWAGTWSAGLSRLEPDSGAFVRYRHDPADPGSLSHDRVYALHEDDAGSLWVGGLGGALQRYDPASDGFVHYRHDPLDPDSLSYNTGIWAIVEDRTGTLWVAARGAGLDTWSRFGAKFVRFAHQPGDPDSLSSNHVRAILEDRGGTLWVGTRDAGLNRIDLRDGTVTRFRHHPERAGSLPDDFVYTVHRGPSGIPWVGTLGGLSRFDSATETFTHSVHDPGDPSSLSNDRVGLLHEDPDGTLWVGTLGGGLNRLDPETGEFTHYRHRPGDASSLGHDVLMALNRDRAGTLWVGGEGSGLNRFDPATETFTRYHFPETGLHAVTEIFEDRGGRLWLGTFNGGLHLFDRKGGTSRYFTQRDGLGSDSIYHILEADDGRLWLSTGKGLSVFDPGGEVFTNYDHTDGLRGDWAFGGACKSARGRLYFGASTGLYAMSPGDLAANPHPPPVVLTDFRIGSQPVAIAAGGPLARHISVVEEIRLSHRQNVITFGFAALHYSYPADNLYAYRMEPFDGGWSWPSRQRRVIYTRLPPGRYTFRVKAASSDGVWNQEGAAVRLVIAPPWWRTWWAYVACLLAGLAGLLAAERFQRVRVVRREQEKGKLARARLRAEAAELEAKAAEAEARALTAEIARQTHELEEARQLQLSMLPAEVPRHPALDVAATMITATEVGGDYYDFDLAEDGTLTVAVGDATGHGSRAGTMVTAAKSVFQFLIREPDVARALQRGTEAIKRLHLRKLHMAMLLVKVKDRELTLANAGMPPILLYRPATREIEVIAVAGAPLGSFVDFPYRRITVELQPGDKVVMMSDGFVEMSNPDGEMFGYQRVESVFEDVAERLPEQIIRHFSETAAEWTAGRPQGDDMPSVGMAATAGPRGLVGEKVFYGGSTGSLAAGEAPPVLDRPKAGIMGADSPCPAPSRRSSPRCCSCSAQGRRGANTCASTTRTSSRAAPRWSSRRPARRS
ncbi:MAG: SpoIIE family protein phosphatase [bacterium]|nr:SpoIIE family protein phosphatase [bacterium]